MHLKSGIVRNLCWLVVFTAMLAGCSYAPHTTKSLLKKARRNGPYDLVVVPGVPLENGQWSRTMKFRIYWAKYLYDQGIVKNFMFSGSAVSTPYTEAEVMSIYAVALGIPAEVIHLETKAEHSTENIFYGYKKARSLGFKSIALASDPYQAYLLRKFTKEKVDPSIAIIPMDRAIMRKMESSFWEPEIDFESIRLTDFTPLSERQSYAERRRGTRGLRIDETAYD